MIDFQDRARGAFIGLAVGDALGTTLEFKDRDSIPHHTEMSGGGPFSLKSGEWTDDTSMALALADSLLANNPFDPNDLMKRFVNWYIGGGTGRTDINEYSCTGRCFDIGNTTRTALQKYIRDSSNPFAGDTRFDVAGNGSLMRLSPVAIFGHKSSLLTSELAIIQSKTTHGSVQCVEACDYFSEILRLAINGCDKETIFAPKIWPGDQKIKDIAAGDYKGLNRQLIRSSGYVIDTLEAALWSVHSTNSFEEALILAVNLADDADTVGAVTGQLAGALYGMSSIPQRWLEPLAWKDKIINIADKLAGI